MPNMCSWGNFAHNFAGIIKKVILFFKSHRYKEFNPAETSEISEFWWLYSTSHKKISPKYLLVGFPNDILHRFRLPTTPNLALYQFVSGLQNFGSNPVDYKVILLQVIVFILYHICTEFIFLFYTLLVIFCAQYTEHII